MCKIFGDVYSDMLAAYSMLELNGSSITAVDYDSKSLTTIITLSFCNSAQSGYDKSEPEVITVFLRFERSFINMEPKVRFQDFSGKICDTECPTDHSISFVVKTEDNSVQRITVTTDILYLCEKKDEFDNHDVVLAESEHYALLREYEECYLVFKDGGRRSVSIGDFYGDPEFALFDKNEKFVVMGGCGIIVYFLEEPWQIYSYNTESAQWIDISRDGDHTYFDSVRQISDNVIELTESSGKSYEYVITR